MKLIFVLISFVYFLQISSQLESCGISNGNEIILDGNCQIGNDIQFPWHVYFFTGGYSCEGSIICKLLN